MNHHAHLVLSYNHPNITQRCLTQLLKLVLPEHIYLLHNGSSPECQSQLQALFPSIQHLNLEANAGFSAGANFGLTTLFKIGWKWVFFHTNDTQTIMLPNEPLSLLAPGIYAPLLFKRQTPQIDSIGGVIHLSSRKPLHAKSSHEFSSLCAHYQLGLHPNIPYIPGTAFLMHQSCWLKVGGFDESYHTYWEDIDWSFRALKQNIYLGTLPKWVLRHGIGKTCHKKPFYTQELFPKNRSKFFTKFNL